MKKSEKEEIKILIDDCFKSKINELEENKRASKQRNYGIVLQIIISLLPTIVLGVCGFLVGLYKLPGEFSDFKNEYDKSMLGINGQIAQYQTQLLELENLKGQFQEFEKNQISVAPTVYPTKDMINIIDLSSKSNQMSATDDIKVITSDLIVAESGDGKNKFTAEQICNQRIIMPYEQNGIEVCFVGQLNENLHWNGNCLLNKYDKDNNLIFISEATYIDGILIGYKQAFIESDKETWCLSERVSKNGGFDGTSVEYTNVIGLTKTFTLENVSGSDIITFEDFKESHLIVAKMDKFYYGMTNNGVYNDTTVNAYYVSFDMDGNVLTLYQGGFYNGEFRDYTGNAWYITRKTSNNDLNKKYDYYKGNFNHNTRDDDGSGILLTDITLMDIANIIDGKYFVPSLKWYGSES